MRSIKLLQKKGGFTLIEVLLVVMLLSILAAIGVTAFVNSTDAKNAATREDLSILRKGIAAQFAKTQMDCNNTNTWPLVASINANDITTGTPAVGTCTAAQVPLASDRQFTLGPLPVNPWGGNGHKSTVTACPVGNQAGANSGTATSACAPSLNGEDCAGNAAYATTDDGWCYDPTSGAIWANSSNNTGTIATGTENSF